MNGKQKCRILKDIRRQIAEANDIDLVIEECQHKGNCRGTCPRCESEVRYLERELEKRRNLQKRVALAGVSAGMTLALSGCAAIDALVDTVGKALPGPTPTPEIEDLEGEVYLPPDDPEDIILDGDVGYELNCDDDESDEELITMGVVPMEEADALEG